MHFYRISLTNLSPEPPYHLPRNIKISTYSDKLPRNDHLRQKNPPTKKNFKYNQLSTRTNKHSLYGVVTLIHIYTNTYMMPYILLYILYPARTNRFTRKAHPKILFISNAQFGMKHRSSKKRKNRFFIFKTLLSRFLPMLNLVIRPSFLSYTAYTLMVVFYIFALS